MLNLAFNTALSIALLWLCAFGGARAAGLPDDLAALQHDWAKAYYAVPTTQKNAAFEALEQQAAALVNSNAGRAEPLVWQAIVLSSHAKFEGGLGALARVKHARELLHTAEKLDANALDGSIYTSLGSLYANVPGWPLAFGDKRKARQYLDKALALNPDGIDPNFFLAELLIKQEDKAGARAYLLKALAAPPRPGREDADAGRRAEARAVLAALDRS
ncbi:MAG: tetratricopeptide repeat protein [Panacagrimonas sp.]